MSDFFIHIFPGGSLSGSVTTTVLIGVWVSVFFNLRLGWPLSGLVVPGYLVPLMIVKPWAAGIVVLEGIITYFLVYFLFEVLSKLGYWGSVFGRDRFFALLLSSVIVRVILDGWLLPVLGEWVTQTYAIRFDYRNQLHSFGLIVVALIANQFWKPGFIKGLFPFLTVIVTTFFLVRYGLMEFTNFSISNIAYMYEDIAANILAAPKAYIILLTTAFIASHMNLHYGWEYSGILIPSLIALLWYQPAKIMVSIWEALVIIAIMGLALKLPLFKRVTMEGGRKILLAFNISFAYKYVLAYTILFYFPDKKITDYYAFGYLLPSLLAIKMMDKEIVARTTRVTIQTSFVSIVLASLIGYGFTLLPDTLDIELNPKPHQTAPLIAQNDQDLILRLNQEKLEMYKNRFIQNVESIQLSDLGNFQTALKYINRYTSDHEPDLLAQAQTALTKTGYQLHMLNQRYILIKQTGKEKGGGLFVIDTKADSSLIIQVPLSLSERGAMEAGLWLFTTMEAKALSFGGDASPTAYGQKGPLADPGSFFHTFHKTMNRRDVLQVRTFNAENRRVLGGKRDELLPSAPTALESHLYIKNTLPRSLDLTQLKTLMGEFKINWGITPIQNIQRDISGSGFAELFLTRASIRRLFYKSLWIGYDVPVQVRDQKIDGYLQDWIFTEKANLAPQGSELYVKPQFNELLFFDEEVLKPMLHTARTQYQRDAWTAEGLSELNAISAAASVLGYKLTQYRHKQSRQEYLILFEDDQKPTHKYWGTYVFRLGPCEKIIVQVPRPLFEVNAFEYAVFLFEQLNAQALLISGGHKDTNRDGSSDLIRQQNISSVFNLVNQVSLREAGDAPSLVLQIRALGVNEDQPYITEEMLISFNHGATNIESLSPLGQKLITYLTVDKTKFRFVDGKPETAGYEVGGLPQSRYLEASENKEFGILWLSTFTRRQHRQQTENFWQEKHFAAVGLASVTGYLQPYLAEYGNWAKKVPVPEKLFRNIEYYMAHKDVVSLVALKEAFGSYTLKRYIDLDSRQSFLMVFNTQSQLVLVANLMPRKTDRLWAGGSKTIGKRTARFIDARAAFLICGNER